MSYLKRLSSLLILNLYLVTGILLWHWDVTQIFVFFWIDCMLTVADNSLRVRAITRGLKEQPDIVTDGSSLSAVYVTVPIATVCAVFFIGFSGRFSAALVKDGVVWLLILAAYHAVNYRLFIRHPKVLNAANIEPHIVDTVTNAAVFMALILFGVPSLIMAEDPSAVLAKTGFVLTLVLLRFLIDFLNFDREQARLNKRPYSANAKLAGWLGFFSLALLPAPAAVIVGVRAVYEIIDSENMAGMPVAVLAIGMGVWKSFALVGLLMALG